MLADDLAGVLGDHPDATAAELAAVLGAAGVVVGAAAVSAALYSAHGRFRADGGDPVRWRLAGASVGPVASAPTASRFDAATPTSPPTLYPWQAAALAAWTGRGRRGVVEAVTGAGKTMVGVAAVLDQRRTRGQALILVPTTELARQWAGVLARWCEPATPVGMRGDGDRADLTSHDVVVAVVNSLRADDARPIRPDGLLVADECHRYASTVNRLALDPRLSRRLGLSATYARDDDGHRLLLDPYFGGTCFTLGYPAAAAGGVIARPVVALVAVALHPDERAAYTALSTTIGRNARRLVDHHRVPAHPYAAFMVAVNALADRGGDGEASKLARSYRTAVLERRHLLAQARAKGDRLDTLVPAVRAADRTIVFTHGIAASEAAATSLAARGVTAAAIHSGLGTETRRSLLARFADGDLRVLSAPKVLDEGVDVPAADLAVIVGASRSRRQMVQRMGRVLRVKADGRMARFAVLFAEGTVEDPARGAHDGFLDEVTAIAVDVRTFAPSAPPDEVNRFLAPR